MYNKKGNHSMAQSKNVQRKSNTNTAKANNLQHKSNLLKITALTALALAVVITAVVLIAYSGGSVVKDSDLVIKTSEITEKAKFFPVKVGGTKLEVLAVRAPDNTIRTAFNTCQVCYSSGRGYYVQEGNTLVCQNCGNRFGMDDVEVTRGGCNPVPITGEEKTVTDTSITISKEFLNEARAIFANWKR